MLKKRKLTPEFICYIIRRYTWSGHKVLIRVYGNNEELAIGRFLNKNLKICKTCTNNSLFQEQRNAIQIMKAFAKKHNCLIRQNTDSYIIYKKKNEQSHKQE